MSAFNLLPPELKPKSSVVKISKTLNKTVITAAVLFLAALMLTIGIFVFFSTQINQSSQRLEELKGRVRALEDTEQRVVLVRDRLQKINKILSTPGAGDGVLVLENVLGITQGDPVVGGVELTSERAEITLVAQSSQSLTRFFAQLISLGEFERIELVSFVFRPSIGYEVTVGL